MTKAGYEKYYTEVTSKKNSRDWDETDDIARWVYNGYSIKAAKARAAADRNKKEKEERKKMTKLIDERIERLDWELESLNADEGGLREMVKGYKVFNKDWTCRNKQYSCPGVFEEYGKLEMCEHGMHFCKIAADCFSYYRFDTENHVAEVIASGTVIEEGNKCCTDKLEIVREIPWDEVLQIVNAGKKCTGFSNSGDYNSGQFGSVLILVETVCRFVCLLKDIRLARI